MAAVYMQLEDVFARDGVRRRKVQHERARVEYRGRRGREMRAI
jgi:hypothetical protein